MNRMQHIISGMAHDGLEIINTEKQSGFFDLPKSKKCLHPEHNPPSHINIPHGKGYRHVCPGCGTVAILIPPQISCCG